jgi:hypothetical protein
VAKKPCDHPLWAKFLSCFVNGRCKHGHTAACSEKHLEEAREEYRKNGRGLNLVMESPEVWDEVLLVMKNFQGTALLQCKKNSDE